MYHDGSASCIDAYAAGVIEYPARTGLLPVSVLSAAERKACRMDENDASRQNREERAE